MEAKKSKKVKSDIKVETNAVTGNQDRIKALLAELVAEVDKLGTEEKISVINTIKKEIHSVSPFKSEPVDCVIWMPASQIIANNYNPNKVAPPEMKLLEHSIHEDGYTQPIVVFQKEDKDSSESDVCEVIDGFHRNRVGRENKEIKDRIHGYLPVTVVNDDRTGRKDRIASTIRHNRARGAHAIEPMTKIVAELYFSGWSNKRIAEELGMDKDEVLRLKQFTGLGALFGDREFSKGWE